MHVHAARLIGEMHHSHTLAYTAVHAIHRESVFSFSHGQAMIRLEKMRELLCSNPFNSCVLSRLFARARPFQHDRYNVVRALDHTMTRDAN